MFMKLHIFEAITLLSVPCKIRSFILLSSTVLNQVHGNPKLIYLSQVLPEAKITFTLNFSHACL